MNDPARTFIVDERGHLDPYRLAHKGVRVMLARLLESAGRADFADPHARARIREECLNAVTILRAHARLEALFLDPLLAAIPCAGAGFGQYDHAKLESELFTLVLDLDPPSHGEPSIAEQRAHGHRFYLALTRLVAHYLLHMADEEARALALLHAHVDADVLRQTVLVAQSSMSAAEASSTFAAILEGVAPYEREELEPPKPRRASMRPSRRPPSRRSIGR